MICNNCKQDGGDGKFCKECGSPLKIERECPKCHTKTDGKFCPECGTSLIQQTTASQPVTNITSSSTNVGQEYLKIKGTVLTKCEKKATEVVIPSYITVIKDNAFSGCKKLTKVVIPESVTTIGAGAFSGCEGLEHLVLPNSITSIGQAAFFECKNLKSVNIPTKLTTIGDMWFKSCWHLQSVVIPEGVTKIEREAFFVCVRMQSVTLPSTLKEIGFCAFAGCAFSHIDIPNSVTKIVGSAFAMCKNLKSIHIPSSVTDIYKNPFGHNLDLDTLTVDGHNPNFYGENCLIEKSTGRFIAGTNDGIIPSNGTVKTIGEDAFSGRTKLSCVHIPQGVQRIEGGAFGGCKNLTSVTIANSVNYIAWTLFDDCPSLKEIIYLGTPEQWEAIQKSNWNWQKYNLIFADQPTSPVEGKDTAPKIKW